jgi:hypothetical protein
VGARILPYVGAGVAVGLVFGVLSGWTQQLNLEGMSPSGPVAVGLVPLISISLALFVLARVERSWAVLSFAIGYLVVTLLACGIGRNLGLNIDANLSPTWSFLPALAVTGGVLFLGGAGFALAERRHA